MFKVPQIETGFKPIQEREHYLKPIIPNTYRSYKKPKTTPGLRNYSTHRHKYKVPAVTTRLEYPVYHGALKSGPVQFPPNREDNVVYRKSAISRFYQTMANQGFIYSKKIKYQT